MVSGGKIEGREIFRGREGGEDVTYTREGKCVFLTLVVQPAIVNAKAEFGRFAGSGLLGKNDYGRGVGAVGRADNSSSQEFVNLLLEPLEGLERDWAGLNLERGVLTSFNLVFEETGNA